MTELADHSTDYSVVEREPPEVMARNLRIAAHLWSSATAFFFAAFLFAYFYLRSLDSSAVWRPKHVDPSLTLGTLTAAALVAAAALLRLRLADHRAVVVEDGLGEVLGVVAVGGESHRDRLSDVADAALGQRRPAAGDEARPGHDDRFQPERRGVEDVVGQRHGGERRVADRRADEGGFEGIGKLEVGQVDRLAENLHLGCTSRIASTIGV